MINFKSAMAIASNIFIPSQLDGKKIKWVLYKEQRRVLKEIINSEHGIVILKQRQIGISTLCLFYCVLHVIANPGSRIAIVANDFSTSSKLSDDFCKFVDQLGVKITKKNLKKITLANNSEIEVLTAGAKLGSAGRGRTYSLIMASEVAYWPESFAAVNALSACLTSNGKIIFESTATAGDNYFNEAWNGENKLNKIFTSFEAHPNYKASPDLIDDNTWEKLKAEYRFTDRSGAAWWYRKLQSTGNDEVRCLREYPIYPEDAFRAASGRWIQIDPEVIPYLEHHRNQKIHVYHAPERDHVYVSSVDSASGGGGDSSVICIWDATAERLAASFCCNETKLDVLVESVYSILHTDYNPQLMFIESNGLGNTTITFARRANYPVIDYVATNPKRYDGLLWVRNQITDGKIKADENLLAECRSCMVLPSKTGLTMDRFAGKKDFLSALGFLGIHEAAWKEVRVKKVEKVYGPNEFNAQALLERAARNKRRNL